MLGIKRVFVVGPAPSSTSIHLKFILAGCCKENLKGNWQKKRRNPRSYHPKFRFAGF
jgi:hypothetical protein